MPCCILLVCLVLPTAPASAQDDDGPSGPSVARTAGAPAAWSGTLPMTRAPEPSGQAGVPANLEARGALSEVVERMWRRSPTFRRQCARLAQRALQVTIQMRLLRHERLGGLSHVALQRGRPTDVQVYVGHRARTIETIAHELEHIVEQLDGVDLVLQVERGAARLNGSHRYETLRAMEVGQRVAREVRNGLEPQAKGRAGEG